MTVVLDASAFLALVFDEPGSEAVADYAEDAAISAVNAAEIISKLTERNIPESDFESVWRLLSTFVRDFGAKQALECGQLRQATRQFGLSLGDRACLALALELEARAVTSDRAWTGLDIGVEIEVIR